MGQSHFARIRTSCLSSLEVTALVEIEVGPACWQAWHGGQVEDNLDALESVSQRVETQVAFVENEGGVAPGCREVGFLDSAGVVGNEGVEANNSVAFMQKVLTEVRANETSSACNKTFHRTSSISR